MKKVIVVLLPLLLQVYSATAQAIVPDQFFHLLMKDMCSFYTEASEQQQVDQDWDKILKDCTRQAFLSHQQDFEIILKSKLEENPQLTAYDAGYQIGHQLAPQLFDSLIYHCPSFFNDFEKIKQQDFIHAESPKSVKKKLKKLDRKIAKDPAPEYILERVRLSVISGGNKETAIAELTILIEDHNSYVGAYLLRALVREQAGLYKGALLDYETVQSFFNLSGNKEIPISIFISSLKKKMQ